MKRILYLAIGLFSFSTFAIAADESWVGELYNIVPNKAGVSEEYCKTHSIDTYKTTVQDTVPEVVANNGVKAKDIDSTITKKGGLDVHTANVLFSGETDGVKWQEKAYFIYYGLTKDSPLQGVWYSKNCKGFYKAGPV